MINKNVNSKALLWPLESTQLRPISLIRRKKWAEIVWIGGHVILVKLGIITVKKSVMTLTIIQSQKTNLNLNNLLINGWS